MSSRLWVGVEVVVAVINDCGRAEPTVSRGERSDVLGVIEPEKSGDGSCGTGDVGNRLSGTTAGMSGKLMRRKRRRQKLRHVTSAKF